MIMFIIFSMFPVVTLSVEVLTMLQNGINPFAMGAGNMMIFMLKLFAIFIYVSGVILGFNTYREFKAYQRGNPDSNTAQSMPMTNLRNMGTSVTNMFSGNNDQTNNQESSQEGFTAFAGRGVVL